MPIDPMIVEKAMRELRPTHSLDVYRVRVEKMLASVTPLIEAKALRELADQADGEGRPWIYPEQIRRKADAIEQGSK
jgi:hypothetical protein